MEEDRCPVTAVEEDKHPVRGSRLEEDRRPVAGMAGMTLQKLQEVEGNALVGNPQSRRGEDRGRCCMLLVGSVATSLCLLLVQNHD